MIGCENSLLLLCFIFAVGKTQHPEQIHLSLAQNGHDIVVTWSTRVPVHESYVWYGVANQLNQVQTGKHEIFTDGGVAKLQQEIHRVTLTNLKPNTVYVYIVGSLMYSSGKYQFRTFPATDNWSPSFAIYGDLGLESGYSIPHLTEEVQSGMYDAIFHNGDFGYNLEDNNGTLCDAFLREIEPFAAMVPYMTTPGNHEKAYNFSHYRKRFTMPGDNEGLYYSINIGPVHVITFSSEIYYFLENDRPSLYTIKDVERQYRWIIQDLIKATKNRKQQPWIVVMAHRPMYCTSTTEHGDDCTRDTKTLIRLGIGDPPQFGLEDVFYAFGVDILFWAHEHNYERFYPIYNYKAIIADDAYVNPKAPIHIITGAAGCDGKKDNFSRPAPSYSAARTRNFGYTRLKVFNRSHAYLEQVSVRDYPMYKRSLRLESDRAVVDQLWIIKDDIFTYIRHLYHEKNSFRSMLSEVH